MYGPVQTERMKTVWCLSQIKAAGGRETIRQGKREGDVCRSPVEGERGNQYKNAGRTGQSALLRLLPGRNWRTMGCVEEAR